MNCPHCGEPLDDDCYIILKDDVKEYLDIREQTKLDLILITLRRRVEGVLRA